MGKIVGWTAALLLIPQGIVGAFFLLARAVLGPSKGLAGLYVLVTGLVLLASCFMAACYLSDHWIPAYMAERRALKAKQEAERAALRATIDAEIGIPHIGRRP